MDDRTMLDSETTGGARRRTVIKRAALIGGATVWSTPLVQSIAAPALAMGGSDTVATTEPVRQVTMEIYVLDPRYPNNPPTRVCKTIPSRGATPAEQDANSAQLAGVYCGSDFVTALMFALLNQSRFELPRSCAATDVPTSC